MNEQRFRQHSSHWGTFSARRIGDRLEIRPFEGDPDPSPLLGNMEATLNHPVRLRKPLVRKGWLTDGPGPDSRRGTDDYIEMDWEEALDLAAKELVRLGAGPDAATQTRQPGAQVFGGSYGWSSAGRFHHAQSQVHRFLNTVFGGYVKSVDTYSSGAGAVILSYVVGNGTTITRDHPYWQELAEDSELVIAFGGLPVRNSQVSNGGNSVHIGLPAMREARQRGCGFVLVSPLRDDLPAEIDCEWLAPRPGTDTALMLAMAYHLQKSGLVNHDYLERYTVGYATFETYLLGTHDGIPKSPQWAEAICGIPAAVIEALAEKASAKRTFINVTYSLQRAQNGEQPVWMALVLSAMLGHMGKEGGGYCYGLSSIGNIGKHPLDVPIPTFSQKHNNVSDFIPVARISDLLLKPGEQYTYKGEVRTYADIRLVYWAGGNPFHHHQDLTRLKEAFSRPDTIIVNESVATATTRHADIIFPTTTTFEREDIGASANDPYMFAMERLSDPVGEAKDDYDIFAALARHMGMEDAFTEGKTSGEWLRVIYRQTADALAEKGLDAPEFDDFWQRQRIDIPVNLKPGMVARFHSDPDLHALPTESGKIEITCAKIANSPHSGLPAHPVWISPDEWLGGDTTTCGPLQLVANQPSTRLHSQLDFGAFSVASKINGREPIRINPEDATSRNIRDGDTVRIFNDRGATLAGAVISDDVRPGVVQLSTGAWYKPALFGNHGVICQNGNPNAITRDIGASALSQGCAGQLAMVDIALFEATPGE